MKRRIHKSTPKQGSKRSSPSSLPTRPPATLPTSFYGQIAQVGAHHVVNIFHRELAGIMATPIGTIPYEVGDIVQVHLHGQTRPPKAEITANLGPHPKQLASLIALSNHQIPTDFTPEALTQTDQLPSYKWDPKEGRTDWRKHPFVTIDGADARDYDDAVMAEPLEDGHFRLRVAIADVSFYVQPNTPLDDDARDRGNSTYLPHFAVPMLPHRLSNDLCSLLPHQDRPVLGVEMVINSTGQLLSHQFHRATIHSQNRLTYEQVEARDVPPDLKPHIKNLYQAYQALNQAKTHRGALDLDLPEAKITLTPTDEIAAIGTRDRLESHRLIEEFMILANVAAATTLSTRAPALYRIHDRPDKTKILTLRASLGPLGFTTPGAESSPKAWATLIAKIQQHEAGGSLMRLLLQSQMQAKYSPDNIGHYGLALPLYAHFTSPIRRYADLVVHRALIESLKLGQGGCIESTTSLNRLGDHLAITERRSQKAEWEARDRLIITHYEKLIGQVWPATVVSVQKFGLFVAIDGAAEGLLPARLLGDEWRYFDTQKCFAKRQGKQSIRLGHQLDVKLLEADHLSGRLTFCPAETTRTPNTESRTPKNPRRPCRF